MELGDKPCHVPRFHLRRIGPRATKFGVADVMDFTKTTTLIGRNKSQVDFLLDSSSPVASQYISRFHARVIVQENYKCRLFNDSLNGIFINNTKMCDSIILQEGDIVTFGHPYGAQLATGVWKRQPDSEYQFLFERCTCQPSLSKKKMNVLEDKVNISKSGGDHNCEDKRTVLDASQILDRCINKITGLAESMISSPRRGNLSSTNCSLDVSDDQRLDNSKQISEAKEEGEDQKRITDFFLYPLQQQPNQSGKKPDAHTDLDNTLVVTSSSSLGQPDLSSNTLVTETEREDFPSTKLPTQECASLEEAITTQVGMERRTSQTREIKVKNDEDVQHSNCWMEDLTATETEAKEEIYLGGFGNFTKDLKVNNNEDIDDSSLNVRINNEDIDDSSLNVRINNEDIDDSSLNVRNNNEDIDVSSMNVKVNNEDIDVSSVNVRINNEDIDDSSMNVKVNNEDIDVSSMNVKVNNEGIESSSMNSQLLNVSTCSTARGTNACRQSVPISLEKRKIIEDPVTLLVTTELQTPDVTEDPVTLLVTTELQTPDVPDGTEEGENQTTCATKSPGKVSGVADLTNNVSVRCDVSSQDITDGEGGGGERRTAVDLSTPQGHGSSVPNTAGSEVEKEIVSKQTFHDTGTLHFSCGKNQETSVGNLCESPIIKPNITQTPSIFYSSNRERKWRPVQHKLHFKANSLENMSNELQEPTIGSASSKFQSNTFQSLETEQPAQKQIDVPLFSTISITHRKLSHLITEGRKRKSEEAAKEHECFLQQRKRQSDDDTRVDLLPETIDVIKSCYSLSLGSASAPTRAGSSICNEDYEMVSPQTSQGKLKIFNVKTEKQLDRLIDAIHCQRMVDNVVDHENFIKHYQYHGRNQSSDTSDSHQMQELEYSDILNTVKSTYSLFLPDCTQNLNSARGEKETQISNDCLNLVDDKISSDNQLEYELCIERWRGQIKTSLDSQVQDSDVNEIVRSNYNILSQGNTRVVHSDSESSNTDQQTNQLKYRYHSLAKDFESSNGVLAKHTDKTVDLHQTSTESDIDQTFSTKGTDISYSVATPDQWSVNNTCQTIVMEVNGIGTSNIENETTTVNIDPCHTDTKKLTDTDTAWDSTTAHFNPILPVRQSREHKLNMEREPLESQFTTSTPNIDNNNQDQEIPVSPVLRVSLESESHVVSRVDGEDISTDRTLENVTSHCETMAANCTVTLTGITNLNGTESNQCTSETECSDLETPVVPETGKSKGSKLSANRKNPILQWRSGKDKLTGQKEETEIVDGETRTLHEDEQTIQVEQLGHESKSDADYPVALIDPLQGQNIFSVKETEHNIVKPNHTECEIDPQRPCSPELFSQVSTIEVSAGPDLTQAIVNNHIDSETESESVTNGDSSQVLVETELIKCGLATNTIISQNPLASNTKKSKCKHPTVCPALECVQNSSGLNKTEIYSDKHVLENPSPEQGVDKKSENLTVEASPDYGSPDQLHLSSSVCQCHAHEENPTQTELSVSLDCTSSLRVVASQHGVSPNTSLSLTQMSGLENEEEMCLVWSQADLSGAHSSGSSNNQENMFGDFDNILQTSASAHDKDEMKVPPSPMKEASLSSASSTEELVLHGRRRSEVRPGICSAQRNSTDITSHKTLTLTVAGCIMDKCESITDRVSTTTEITVDLEYLKTSLVPVEEVNETSNSNQLQNVELQEGEECNRVTIDSRLSLCSSSRPTTDTTDTDSHVEAGPATPETSSAACVDLEVVGDENKLCPVILKRESSFHEQDMLSSSNCSESTGGDTDTLTGL